MSKRTDNYKLRKSQGMCYRCFARPAEPGRKRCWYCADVQREYNRKYQRTHPKKAKT